MGALAKAGPRELLSAASLAKNQNLSIKYTEHLLQLLNKAKLIHSERGAHGGYSISRPAKNISILDIAEAVYKMDGLVKCISLPKACKKNRHCAARILWSKIDSKFTNIMRKTKLTHLLQIKC